MNVVVCDSTGQRRVVGSGCAGLESTAGPSPVGSPALLQARGLTKRFGERAALVDVSLDLWPGEVLAVVGESGSGKTTLLQLLAARLQPDAGSVLFQDREGQMHEVTTMDEARLRRLARTDWGFIHQDAALGLRLSVSAGANIGERLMALGERNFGRLRGTAIDWLQQVEIDPARIDDLPLVFSGGMRQRLQIARNLVTSPRLVFMDEPTSGLDVSVQARILDLIRRLSREMQLAVVLVTHDLAVARLLAERMIVMRSGRIVEAGLTDQLLEDPRHPYTQLLVSSVLPT